MGLRALGLFIDESIDSRATERTGFIVGPPRIETLGGKETWVADVDVGGGEELLISLPISQYAQQLRHADEGTPVKLARNPAGLWQVIGRAFEKVGNTNVETLNITTEGFLYTYGLSLDTLGSPQTQQGNPFTPPATGTSVSGFIHSTLPYGSISPYGTVTYGAIQSVKTGNPNPAP